MLTNPRTEATVESWPHGRNRVTCYFKLETNKKGTRCNRTTTGKPKRTTYYDLMRIVDSDIDGRIYLIAYSKYNGMAYKISGTLKGYEVFSASQCPKAFNEIMEILGHAKSENI